MSAVLPKAVVTGGGGFIGSHAVDLLAARGYRVAVIDDFSTGHRANLAHHAGDDRVEIHDRDILTLEAGDSIFADARYVIHYAGIGDIVPSIERPIDYMAVNVQGTVRVLECARAACVEKFVYAASSSCYGLAAVPTDESHPIVPEHPYALSKYLGEQAAFHWHKVYGLPVNSVRIFNAYGPRVRTTGAYGAVFGVFFKQKLAGKPFTVVGDGTQTRDFVFVTDVAAGFVAAAESEVTGECFNLGADAPQSVNRLVALIGGDAVYLPKRPGEPDCTWANIGKISSMLGWRPQVPFETGVARMMQDIERWRDAPLWEPGTIAEATKTWFQYLGKSDSKT
jgi:UDP-glucose 4-epimerase